MSGYPVDVNTPGLVVVGSGPAGISAGEAFRRYEGDLPVTILTADPHPPYARPPLSKEFLRGETDDIGLHPAQWYAERRLSVVHVGAVTEIEPSSHTVTADGVEFSYRSLVLACGAQPKPLPVPGGELARPLRSLRDATALRESCEDAQSAVVVGAGFIGCEAATSLAMRGLVVTLVAPEEVPQVERLGRTAGKHLLALLDDCGVRYVRAGVHAIDPTAVHLDDGSRLSTDLTLAATGVTPNCGLAEAAGMTVLQSRVVTGPDLATSADNVYAAGDVALAYNTTAGRAVAIEHWQDAADQGEIAGANAAGDQRLWSAVPGFWSTIGASTIKYHAWGDGYDRDRIVERDSGFTVWYEADGVAVGVLTCGADDDYELGGKLIAGAKPAPLATT